VEPELLEQPLRHDPARAALAGEMDGKAPCASIVRQGICGAGG
jgi:hypothetical protein